MAKSLIDLRFELSQRQIHHDYLHSSLSLALHSSFQSSLPAIAHFMILKFGSSCLKYVDKSFPAASNLQFFVVSKNNRPTSGHSRLVLAPLPRPFLPRPLHPPLISLLLSDHHHLLLLSLPFHHHRHQQCRPAPPMSRSGILIVLASLAFWLLLLSAANMINPFNLLLLLRGHTDRSRCQTLAFEELSHGQSNITTSTNIYTAFDSIAVDNSSLSIYRRPDTFDTFANYKYRQDPKCDISSLSLHKPFSPLCPNRPSFLDAFSGGGRIGFDAPFMPRDCDMRWYATEEVCDILGRFEKVIVVGDSMMRHVVGAMNVLLRKDLGYGAVTGWNFGEEER